jgi:calcium permeable stress-gated cation channel
MILVPEIMRMLATLAGAVSLPHRELFTQNAYFCFQLIQVFLIRTLADAASTVLIQIVESPSAVFRILSQAIPTSSNFYISYFIVQGLAMASNVLAQVTGCLVFYLLYRWMADTPRAMYARWTSLRTISWGSTVPVYTTITVISRCSQPSSIEIESTRRCGVANPLVKASHTPSLHPLCSSGPRWPWVCSILRIGTTSCL